MHEAYRKDRLAAFTDRALELLQGLHAERVGSLLKVQHNVNSGTEPVGHPGLNMIAESPCASVLSLGVCASRIRILYPRNDGKNAYR